VSGQGIRYNEPLPKEVVRDLLGVVRSLYRAELEAGGNPVVLQELVEIGTDFRDALRVARHEVGSLGHRAAWTKAERGCARLGAMLDPSLVIGPAVMASIRKVLGR
jgi:hypothetical protein